MTTPQAQGLNKEQYKRCSQPAYRAEGVKEREQATTRRNHNNNGNFFGRSSSSIPAIRTNRSGSRAASVSGTSADGNWRTVVNHKARPRTATPMEREHANRIVLSPGKERNIARKISLTEPVDKDVAVSGKPTVWVV